MLVSILNFIFTVILFLLNVLSWAVLIYVILALVIPQNKVTLFLGKYVEPVLIPIRAFLFKVFPGLRRTGVDFSPLALYLLIQIAEWLIRLLYNILL